jgi:hypothetical protein
MGTTVFTGPVLAGNVLNSDGSGNLAGVGGSNGTQNVGFCVMAQSQAITQAGPLADGVFTTSIVIPAQSQIVGMYLYVSTVWDGVASTLGIGTTASATAFTAASAVAGGTAGRIVVTPGTGATQIANWLNTSSTSDVEIVVTSTNTGAGAGTLVVEYLQAINGFTNGQYT